MLSENTVGVVWGENQNSDLPETISQGLSFTLQTINLMVDFNVYEALARLAAVAALTRKN